MSYEPLPTNHNETIAVIGSGVAGSLAASRLANEGYGVTLIEQLPEPFSGSSAYAAQIHLGGLYSGNPDTAYECLLSAIEMKRCYPESLTEKRVQFLVAEKSDISVGDLIDFHEDLAGRYADLPEEDHVFGLPEDFFEILQPDEYAFAKHIAGGILGREVTFNMARTREMVLRDLGRFGGRLMTSTKVIDVELSADDRFNLVVENGEDTAIFAFDQVVNAAGYGARPLDHKLGDRTQYSLMLKTWNLVQEKCGETTMPPFAVVRGDFITHYPRPGQDGVSVLNAAGSASRLDHRVYDADNATLPSEWEEVLRSRTVPRAAVLQKEILDFAGDHFLTDASKLQPVRLVPGVAVAYSTAWADRKQKEVNIVVPGWQTAVPTKVSHAVRLASEVVHNALDYSQQRVAA